jgi:proline racemase/predicted transcriptional regulator
MGRPIKRLADGTLVQGFDAGGYVPDVDFDAANVLTDYSSTLNPYGSPDTDFYTNNMANAAARAAAAIAAGSSNVGGFGGDTNAWDMVPEAGTAGSVNDQVNKQGIIDAYLAELDDLGKSLAGVDASFLVNQGMADANAANYALGMTQSQDADTSLFDIINGKKKGYSVATLEEIAARNNTARPLPTSLSPLELLDLELASDEAERNSFYGTLNNTVFTPSAGSLIAAQNAVDAINAARIAALTPAQIAAIEEANALSAAQAASQATIDAAAVVQQQQDDFKTAVNAAGGMNKGTIGLVIDAAQESFGGDTSLAIVTVIAEALKSGVTIDDIAAETGMTPAAILAAAKDAGQDPDAKLSTQEMLQGGLNTAYDVVNSAVELVEKGFEITGIEKLINAAGNIVAKIGGLDPAEASKVLVVNANGGITIEASQDDGTGNQGGLRDILPTSGYIPIGSTTGGTTYGVDTGLEIVNTVLQKIITNGGLTSEDVDPLLSSVLTDVTGIDLNAANNVIDGAQTIVDTVKKVITDATQKAALAKATKVFDEAGGGAAGTAAVLQALEDNNLTVQDLADQTGLTLTSINDVIAKQYCPPDSAKNANLLIPTDQTEATFCNVIIEKQYCPPDSAKNANLLIPTDQTEATFCNVITEKQYCPPDSAKNANLLIPTDQTEATFCNVITEKQYCPPDSAKNANLLIPTDQTEATFCNVITEKQYCPPDSAKNANLLIPTDQTEATFCNVIIEKQYCPPDSAKNANLLIPTDQTEATFCNVITEKQYCPPDSAKNANLLIPTDQTEATFCNVITEKQYCPPDSAKNANLLIPTDQTEATFCNVIIEKQYCPPDSAKNANLLIPTDQTEATFCNVITEKQYCPPDSAKNANLLIPTDQTEATFCNVITENVCPPGSAKNEGKPIVPPATLLPKTFVLPVLLKTKGSL